MRTLRLENLGAWEPSNKKPSFYAPDNLHDWQEMRPREGGYPQLVMNKGGVFIFKHYGDRWWCAKIEDAEIVEEVE